MRPPGARASGCRRTSRCSDPSASTTPSSIASSGIPSSARATAWGSAITRTLGFTALGAGLTGAMLRRPRGGLRERRVRRGQRPRGPRGPAGDLRYQHRHLDRPAPRGRGPRRRLAGRIRGAQVGSPVAGDAKGARAGIQRADRGVGRAIAEGRRRCDADQRPVLIARWLLDARRDMYRGSGELCSPRTIAAAGCRRQRGTSPFAPARASAPGRSSRPPPLAGGCVPIAAQRLPQDVSAAIVNHTMRRLETDDLLVYYPQGREVEAWRFLTRVEGCVDHLRGVAHDPQQRRRSEDRRDPARAGVQQRVRHARASRATRRWRSSRPTTRWTCSRWSSGLPPDPAVIGCHEITHYVQFQQIAGFAWFWNLLRPGLHAADRASTPWFDEGLAVYYETKLQPGIGRLAWPFWRGSFAAGFAGQALQRRRSQRRSSATSTPAATT